MKCPYCDKETGNADKCPHCKAAIAKPAANVKKEGEKE